MGTYNKGILGAFSGKVGPVVGASWRGKDVLRSLPRKGTRVASEAQVLQRLKFSTVTAFLMPLQPILSRYYGNGNALKTRRNQAMGYHMEEAVTYVDPNYEMILNKVQISKGDLLGLQSPGMVPGAAQSVDITWANNSGEGEADASDVLVVALYEPTTKTTVYALHAEVRSAMTATIIVPSDLSGLTLHGWATFASADEKRYATSIYLGSVVIG